LLTAVEALAAVLSLVADDEFSCAAVPPWAWNPGLQRGACSPKIPPDYILGVIEHLKEKY
jgi:hypothetical protein